MRPLPDLCADRKRCAIPADFRQSPPERNLVANEWGRSLHRFSPETRCPTQRPLSRIANVA